MKQINFFYFVLVLWRSYNIYGKVLAFPGLRADPLFIDGEVWSWSFLFVNFYLFCTFYSVFFNILTTYILFVGSAETNIENPKWKHFTGKVVWKRFVLLRFFPCLFYNTSVSYKKVSSMCHCFQISC